jgi:D-glycero-D-manno-heptose 1,7-bisphosphate phosphatase
MSMSRAVFLDRDGVLIEDVPLMTDCQDIKVIAGVAQALCRLSTTGFKLIVVTNQAIVARGLMQESEVRAMNGRIAQLLVEDGTPEIAGFYFCPHHPNASIQAYRVKCSCRKPEPGLLLRAASDHDVDLKASFLIGDRQTDIVAGAKAGCRTVLVQTGAHEAPLIETAVPIDTRIAPDHVCRDLREAAEWIVGVM